MKAKMGAFLLIAVTALMPFAYAQQEVIPPDATVADTAAVSVRDLIGEPLSNPLTGAELDRETEELASIMRCPVCQALSVADSPTTSALAMREEARDLLAQGYTREQVLQYFEASYGEFILLEPKKQGFNLVVWLAPIVAALLGLVVIAGRLRGQRGAIEEMEAEDPREPEDPEFAAYRERVRREVQG